MNNTSIISPNWCPGLWPEQKVMYLCCCLPLNSFFTFAEVNGMKRKVALQLRVDLLRRCPNVSSMISAEGAQRVLHSEFYEKVSLLLSSLLKVDNLKTFGPSKISMCLALELVMKYSVNVKGEIIEKDIDFSQNIFSMIFCDSNILLEATSEKDRNIRTIRKLHCLFLGTSRSDIALILAHTMPCMFLFRVFFIAYIVVSFSVANESQI